MSYILCTGCANEQVEYDLHEQFEEAVALLDEHDCPRTFANTPEGRNDAFEAWGLERQDVEADADLGFEQHPGHF